ASNLFEEARQTVATAFKRVQDFGEKEVTLNFYKCIAQFYTTFKGKSDLSDVEKILGKSGDELKNPPLCFLTNLPTLLKLNGFPKEHSDMVSTCSCMLLYFADCQFYGKLFEECEKTLNQLKESRRLALKALGEPIDLKDDDFECTIRGRMMQVLFTQGKEDQQVFDSLDPGCLVAALQSDYSNFEAFSGSQKSSQKAKELFDFGKKKILNGDFCESDVMDYWIMDIMKAQVAWGMVEEAKETAVELKAFFDQLQLHERILSFEGEYHINPCRCSSEEFVEKTIAYCQSECTRRCGADVKERASSNVMGNVPPGKLLRAKERADSLKDGLEKLDALLEVLASLDPVKST
ncbi:hypothetical protein ACFLR2_02600, partial [Chlamydiota bacterium]